MKSRSSSFRRALFITLLVSLMTQALYSCKSDSSSCNEGVAVECQCEDGSAGAKACVEGSYLACDCTGATAPTVPAGSVGECDYKELTSGRRICLLTASQTYNPATSSETGTAALKPGKADGADFEEPASQSEDLFPKCPKFHFHDQGALGWCVAHSTVGAMELKHCIDEGKKATKPLSEPHLWHLGKPHSDMDYLCSSGGWYVQLAVDTAHNYWLAKSEVWPNPLLPDNECSTTEELKAWDSAVGAAYPGEEALEQGVTYVINDHTFIPEKNATAIRAELAKGNPVVVSVPTFDDVGWFSDELDENGVPLFDSIRVPDPAPATVGGFHAIFLVGYDNGTKRFRMVNSWGPEWKKNYWGEDGWQANGGTFYIDYDYIEKYSQGGEAIALVSAVRWEDEKPDERAPVQGDIGSPCLNDEACFEGQGLCLKAEQVDLSGEFLDYLDTGFANGHCTLSCDPAGDDCPAGSYCAQRTDWLLLEHYFANVGEPPPQGVCLRTCELQETVDAENPCWSGYGCHARGKDEHGVCLPRCRDNRDCSGPGPTCNSDTGACIWGCAKGWCTVPEGSFTMGCNGGDWDCAEGETPQHEVTLDAFEITRNEVSRKDYYECMVAGECTTPESTAMGNECSIDQYGKNDLLDPYPVNCIDWYQAEDYCQWIGASLCTEAQWEKAARGAADARETPWGGPADTIACDHAHIYWEDYLSGNPKECAPGGQAGPRSQDYPMWLGGSSYGVQNMLGNVTEWTADWMDTGYYSSSPPANPPGPSTGTDRVARGHSYLDQPLGGGLRLSARPYFNPDDAFSTVGTRCCRPSDNGKDVPWSIHFMPPFLH